MLVARLWDCWCDCWTSWLPGHASWFVDGRCWCCVLVLRVRGSWCAHGTDWLPGHLRGTGVRVRKPAQEHSHKTPQCNLGVHGISALAYGTTWMSKTTDCRGTCCLPSQLWDQMLPAAGALVGARSLPGWLSYRYAAQLVLGPVCCTATSTQAGLLQQCG